MINAALLGLIAGPLIAAVGCVLMPRRARLIGVAAGLAQLLAIGYLTLAGEVNEPVAYHVAGWGAPLGIDLYLDGLSLVMLILSVAVGTAILVYAEPYFRAGHAPRSGASREFFYPLFLFTWSALNTVFVSSDLFNLYVTLEMLTLAAVGLVALSGTATGVRAGLRYLFAAVVASMVYLLGVAILYGKYGTLDWQIIGDVAASDLPTMVGVLMMTVALALKTALFPFHFWLPGAHSSAPAPVSALLSGLVLKASFYIQIRLWTVVAPDSATIANAAPVLSALGAAAVFWGSVQAIRQRRAKLMLAYSSVAQVGYLFIVFAWLPDGDALFGAVYLALAHGFAKAGAFLAVGALMLSSGTDVVARWTGIAQREPMLVLALGLAGTSLIGLPPSGGFIGKFVLISSSLEQRDPVLAIVLLLGGLFASMYVFKMLGAAMRARRQDAAAACQPLAPALRWIPLSLSSAAIAMTFTPAPVLELLQIGWTE